MASKRIKAKINILKVIDLLKKRYPDARCALNHKNSLQLLISTILSAQCTDVRVNIVTKDLFRKYKSAYEFALADIADLEEDIRTTGFFRNKAKNIQSCCADIESRFGGKVPDNLDDLVSLAGVGRKTANVILGNAFDVPGMVVDTHVKRISGRLALTKNSDPVKIEFDLMKFVPEEEWTLFSHLLIFHGRQTCKARKPLCDECSIFEFCSRIRV